MQRQTSLFRGKIHTKLKILLVKIKGVCRIVIIKITIILKKLKKMKVYFRLIVSSSTMLGTIFPLPMSNLAINEFPVQNQPQIERLIPESSLHKFRYLEHKPMGPIKIVVQEYPKREISSSNLFGQRQRVRGGSRSKDFGNLNETKKAAIILLLRQVAKQNRGRVANAPRPVVHNVPNSSFSSKIFELVHDCYNAVWRIIEKYVGKANPGSAGIPGAEGFQQNIPGHRPFAERPYQRDLRTPMAKSKITLEEFNKMLNKPADPLTGKLEVHSTMGYNSALFKQLEKTFRDPLHKKQALALIERARAGNMRPGTGTKAIPGTKLFEFRADNGVRVVFQKKNNRIEIVGICNKNNQEKVFQILREKFEK